MAKIKISALSELADGSIATGDYIPIVDVSDTSQASSGTTKKVTITSLASGVAAAFTNNDNPTFQTLTTTGAATIGGAATLSSTLAVTGATTLSSTLAVTGASTLTGNTTIGGTLGVSGNATFDTNTLFVDATNNRVGVGTTSPYTKLHCWSETDTTDESSLIAFGSDTIGKHRMYMGVNNAGGYTYIGSVRTGQAYADMKISPNGGNNYQGNNSTLWSVTSDKRIKSNIEPANLQTCFENVKNLKLKRFNYKEEIFSTEQVKDRGQLGFIAQDVEPIFPKSILKNDLKFNQKYEEIIIPAKIDENGIEIEKERTEKKLISEDVIKDCLRLDSSQIIWALYGAVQHLIAKVEALENK